MNHITAAQLNSETPVEQSVLWSKHVCKDSALEGRAKKLIPKVKAIVNGLNLDPEKVTVDFANYKPAGKSMFDAIHINGNRFSIAVGFYNASKDNSSHVVMDITNEDGKRVTIDKETWKELKYEFTSNDEYMLYCSCIEDEELEEEFEDEIEEEEDETEEEDEFECCEDCTLCRNMCEDFDPEQVED